MKLICRRKGHFSKALYATYYREKDRVMSVGYVC
jgi:hypothetical protein